MQGRLAPAEPAGPPRIPSLPAGEPPMPESAGKRKYRAQQNSSEKRRVSHPESSTQTGLPYADESAGFLYAHRKIVPEVFPNGVDNRGLGRRMLVRRFAKRARDGRFPPRRLGRGGRPPDCASCSFYTSHLEPIWTCRSIFSWPIATTKKRPSSIDAWCAYPTWKSTLRSYVART